MTTDSTHATSVTLRLGRLFGEIQEFCFWLRWFITRGFKPEWRQDFLKRCAIGTAMESYHLEIANRFVDRNSLSVLDVGSGPISKIAPLHPSKKIHLVATDILANRYRWLTRSVETARGRIPLQAAAEELTQVFATDSFDWVNAQNSLDHCNDPATAVREMIAVTKPGGVVTLLHAEREGSKENYQGLHQFDFYFTDGDMHIENRRGEIQSLRQICGDNAVVESVERRHGDVYAELRKVRV